MITADSPNPETREELEEYLEAKKQKGQIRSYEILATEDPSTFLVAIKMQFTLITATVVLKPKPKSFS